jgi:predicted ATPase
VKRALEDFRKQRAGLGWTFAISLPAAAYAQIGEADAGLSLVAEAFEVAEKHGDHFWEAELHRLKGDLLLIGSPPDDDQAERCYRRAGEIAAHQGAKFLELRAATSLARLNQRRGRAQTLQHFESLLAWFQEGHDTADFNEARTVLQGNVKSL